MISSCYKQWPRPMAMRASKEKKNYSQTHTPQETNKEQTNKKTKKTTTKKKGLTNMQLYTCSTLSFFLYITLQFAVTARHCERCRNSYI